MENQPRTPELLAPASSLEAALTAFASGADAVYAGLPKFNARERGKNFSFLDLSKLITVARRRGKKVYVTLNTLIKEQELPEVVEILSQLVFIRPHAVIVQDLALVYLIRQYFPELVIHASTQMGIHNSAGVKLLEKLGVERVILERQVTLEELRLIRERTSMELEVFVHGALCCCRSGTCLFSSWLGGWSGNRGKCKQPCRRRFFSDDGNGFFFSTNDLYSLDSLSELRTIGVASLKIEGRLRKADYVRSVVTSYRMMLDVDIDDSQDVLPEARRVLTESLGRRWSNGFRAEKDFADVIQHERLGVSGVLIGKVSRKDKNGFAVQLSRSLSIGDRIRVQPPSGEEGPVVEVTRLSQDRRSVTRARKNTECFVHCDKEIPNRGLVYMVGRRTDESEIDQDDIVPVRMVVDLQIRISATAMIVSPANPTGMVWERAVDLAPAEKRPLAPDRVEEQFAMTAIHSLQAGSIDVLIDGDLFLPASQLKSIRREFWNWFDGATTDAVLAEAREARTKACLEQSIQSASSPKGTSPETTVLVPGKKNPIQGALTARMVGDSRPCDEVVLPDFCPESNLNKIRGDLKKALVAGIRRVRVTSLYGLILVDECRENMDLTVTTSFPLPVANSLTARQLADLGASRACVWVELEREAMEAILAALPMPAEVFSFGRIPILSTRAELPVTGEIRDDHGNVYRIEKQGGQYLLIPDEALSLPVQKGISSFLDLTHSRQDDKLTSSFNLDHDWV